MAKIGGFQFGDIVLLAVVGVGAYFVYKTVVKPITSAENAVGDFFSGGGGGAGGVTAGDLLMPDPFGLIPALNSFFSRRDTPYVPSATATPRAVPRQVGSAGGVPSNATPPMTYFRNQPVLFRAQLNQVVAQNRAAGAANPYMSIPTLPLH